MLKLLIFSLCVISFFLESADIENQRLTLWERRVQWWAAEYPEKSFGRCGVNLKIDTFTVEDGNHAPSVCARKLCNDVHLLQQELVCGFGRYDKKIFESRLEQLFQRFHDLQASQHPLGKRGANLVKQSLNGAYASLQVDLPFALMQNKTSIQQSFMQRENICDWLKKRQDYMEEERLLSVQNEVRVASNNDYMVNFSNYACCCWRGCFVLSFVCMKIFDCISVLYQPVRLSNESESLLPKNSSFLYTRFLQKKSLLDKLDLKKG